MKCFLLIKFLDLIRKENKQIKKKKKKQLITERVDINMKNKNEIYLGNWNIVLVKYIFVWLKTCGFIYK